MCTEKTEKLSHTKGDWQVKKNFIINSDGVVTDDKKAEDCFELMMQMYKDPLSDPFKITPKNYSETRNERSAAIPMVLIISAELLRRCDPDRQDYYNDICKSITDDIMKYHYHPELKCSFR